MREDVLGTRQGHPVEGTQRPRHHARPLVAFLAGAFLALAARFAGTLAAFLAGAFVGGDLGRLLRLRRLLAAGAGRAGAFFGRRRLLGLLLGGLLAPGRRPSSPAPGPGRRPSWPALPPSWPVPTAAGGAAAVARRRASSSAAPSIGQGEFGDPPRRIESGQDEWAHLPLLEHLTSLGRRRRPHRAQRDIAVQDAAAGHRHVHHGAVRGEGDDLAFDRAAHGEGGHEVDESQAAR